MEPFGSARVVTLPQSGQKVRARRPSLVTLIATGGFPAELASVVWNMYEKGEDPSQNAKDAEGILRMANLIEQYVPHVLVTPQVGPVTQTDVDGEGVLIGTVSMIDLPDMDKRFLFFYGQGLLDGTTQPPASPEIVSAKALESFPENGERADARPAREPVRAETLDVDRAERAVTEPAGA